MTSKINCLIVDDEPIAREIIQNYCSHLPFLQVVASCGNAIEAKTIIRDNKIDLIFLDINMPVLSGLAFVTTLKNRPQVIFTTAYKEYALDAFDLAALDYLLKPFSLERFIIAVDKAMEKLQLQQPVFRDPEEQKDDFIFIKTDGKIYRVLYDELLYAEASGNYTKVVTVEHSLLTAMTFTAFEELIPKTVFIRIHRSFIVNKSKLTHIEGNRVFIKNTEIPVGNNYKESFLKLLGLS